jgi:hypothetical protein
MNEVECPSCGAEVPMPNEIAGDQLTVACPHCGAELRVSIAPTPAEIGVETIFHPQLLPEEDLPARGGSGTMLLDPEDPPARPSGLELKVQAHLDLVGAMPGEGRLPLLDARTVVGRERADITIDDPALSSRHFEVEARGDEYFLRDLNSSNGTALNGDKIRAAQLASGDRIRAGRTTFVFGTQQVIAR